MPPNRHKFPRKVHLPSNRRSSFGFRVVSYCLTLMRNNATTTCKSLTLKFLIFCQFFCYFVQYFLLFFANKCLNFCYFFCFDSIFFAILFALKYNVIMNISMYHEQFEINTLPSKSFFFSLRANRKTIALK